MEEFDLLAPLVLAVGALTIGAILSSMLRRTRIPYTVALFATGLLFGILNRFGCFNYFPMLSRAVNGVADINPDFILYVFIPILIFDAAYELNLHIFKKTVANAALLAVPGLIICMFLTGGLLMLFGYLIPGYEEWTWAFALMFGALISATDPVAVVALLNELKTSKRFSTLVDAESLLNDGTGIVCFMLFFGAYTASGGSTIPPLLQFVEVVAGGALLGYVFARIVIWFITRVNAEENIQNSVIILSAYLVFILSQYYLGVSGIIALMAFGLTVGYVGKPRLKPATNEFMESFWGLLAYIANTFIFIMVGIVIAIKVKFSLLDFGILILIYIALNLFRYLMIGLLYPLMKRLGYGLNRRESIILGWGGLRGALGMTLALMVSHTEAIPEDIRNQILFFTAGTVTLTLCFNATTTRWLLQKLKLVNVSAARTSIENNIQDYLRDHSAQYYEHLKSASALQGANWDKVRTFLPTASKTQAATPKSNAMLAEIRLRILDKEKTTCRIIYNEGIISQTSFKRLMNSLDELYDHDGQYPLDMRTSIFKFCESISFLNTLRKMPILRSWLTFYFKERIAIVYDLARGFIILQEGDRKLLNELENSELVATDQKSVLTQLREEVEVNTTTMNAFIDKLAQDFPKSYRHALTLKAIRMMLCNEKKIVRNLEETGVISEKDAIPLMRKIDARADEVNSFSHTVIASVFRWLFIHKKNNKAATPETKNTQQP